MMIVAKSPLRISLSGGSTDLDAFINKYGHGSVISFPSTLFCYISVHDNNRDKYYIEYSKKEEVAEIDEIKNDVARVALKYFNVGPITITFGTDIFADRSGLAASSAYMVACVKALSLYKGLQLSEFEICKIALVLEREFNPLTGYQDPYGCGIGGFKRIDFYKGKRPSFKYFDTQFITKKYDMYLVHTGIGRSSTEILKDINIDISYNLLNLVDDVEDAIEEKNYINFEHALNNSWEEKKKTSSLIANSPELEKMDKFLMAHVQAGTIKTLKLIGAGGGGYFLILTEKNANVAINAIKFCKLFGKVVPFAISETGAVGVKI